MQTTQTNNDTARVAGQFTGDEAIIMRCDVGMRRTRRNEIRIARRCFRALQDAGYTVTVCNGEDKEVGGEYRAMIDELFSCDEGYVWARNKEGFRNSHIYMVFGNGNNGHDVMSDWGTSLETVLAPVLKWIESREERGL